MEWYKSKPKHPFFTAYFAVTTFFALVMLLKVDATENVFGVFFSLLLAWVAGACAYAIWEG